MSRKSSPDAEGRREQILRSLDQSLARHQNGARHEPMIITFVASAEPAVLRWQSAIALLLEAGRESPA